MFAEVLHLSPRQTEELTVQQIEDAVAYFDERLKEANDGK